MIQLIKYWWLTIKFIYSNLFKRKDKGKYATEEYTPKIYSGIMEEHYENSTSDSSCCASTVGFAGDRNATTAYYLLPSEEEPPPTLYDAHGRKI